MTRGTTEEEDVRCEQLSLGSLGMSREQVMLVYEVASQGPVHRVCAPDSTCLYCMLRSSFGQAEETELCQLRPER